MAAAVLFESIKRKRNREIREAGICREEQSGKENGSFRIDRRDGNRA